MTTQSHYSAEETARRGDALYEQTVRAQVEEGNQGKVVAVDVDSGAFEVAEDALTASRRLHARLPDAEIWCLRVWDRALHRMGGHGMRQKA